MAMRPLFFAGRSQSDRSLYNKFRAGEKMIVIYFSTQAYTLFLRHIANVDSKDNLSSSFHFSDCGRLGKRKVIVANMASFAIERPRPHGRGLSLGVLFY